MTNDSLSSLRRVLAACQREPAVLAPEDAAVLHRMITRAVEGDSLEAALPSDWRQRLQQEALDMALCAMAVPPGSAREQARAKERRLRRYRASAAFHVDMARGSSDSHPEEFAVLRATFGKVPSLASIRRRLG